MRHTKLNILTEVYERLVETEKMMDAASQQIENAFADQCGKRFFANPLGYTVTLTKTVDNARVSFTDFVVSQLSDDYKNLRIDGAEMRAHTREHGFNAETLIRIIRERYADEDEITLQQIKTTLKDLRPWRSGSQIETPDKLTKIGDAGFELRVYGYESEQNEKVATLLKLIDIILNGIKPSKVDAKRVGIGEVYRDEKVKSLRYFKNHALKVIFYTVDDCDKVKAALF